jgi:hypothetical protein
MKSGMQIDHKYIFTLCIILFLSQQKQSSRRLESLMLYPAKLTESVLPY